MATIKALPNGCAIFDLRANPKSKSEIFEPTGRQFYIKIVSLSLFGFAHASILKKIGAADFLQQCQFRGVSG